MATNPIYVETEEEIPEVVERLRRFRGEDTMLVLPMRSRIGQSRFNFQLLRNYAARLGKRVTVVCDDPAVQKMASESGFAVFGAVGPQGEGIPSEPEAPPPLRRWWERTRRAPVTHVGIAAPTKLLTKNATELKPGRFLLYMAAAALLLVGLVAMAIYVPSASVTLVAQAAPFSFKDIELTGQPGKAPIKVRVDVVSKSNSQGFKTTGLIQIPLAPAIGQVSFTNNCSASGHREPGIVVLRGQRFVNTNKIVFAQTAPDQLVKWGQTVPGVDIQAVTPGTSGNVGDHTITQFDPSSFDCMLVTNPLATGRGTDPSSTPQMTEADFDAGRAQLESELRQGIAQELQSAGQPGEKLSETIIYGPPTYTTDHQPNDKVPSFSGTMTITGEGDFYNDADVQKAYQAYLAQRVPNDSQLLTETPITVDYRLLRAQSGGDLTFLGSASAFIAPKLDQAKILSQIVGRPLAQSRLYLERLRVRSVSIKEEPISLPLMPLLARRISIHYVVQQGTPNPTPGQSTPPRATPSPPKATPSP